MGERDETGSGRCGWVGLEQIYIDYHDREWGVPVHDDRQLFEKLILDGFQAGLSWLTILKKRENFLRASKVDGDALTALARRIGPTAAELRAVA